MLKPLIKYTGGKFKEYAIIKHYIPQDFEDYYEPFFGGGGVFFRLYNDGKLNDGKHINDFSTSLMEFYQSVSSVTFSSALNELSDAWEFIKEFAIDFYETYGEKFRELLLKDDVEDAFVTEDIKSYIEKNVSQCQLDLHGFSLVDRIVKSLNDKFSRFRKKNITEEETDVPYKCITTSICQAFYFIIRDMYNDWNNHGHKDNYTLDERSAQWVFIREFCFGSMFRFGSNGDFNIPYGGFSYNSKCFSCKIENITSEEVRNLLKNTDIQCGDFEVTINKWKPSENDFMFLDPPYDSTFSEYDGNSFGRKEHIRLANCLKKCKCKWLMAIGKTDFIADLYKDYHIVEYDKTYMYQARGEYDSKHTTHLIITNYPIKEPETPQLSFDY